MVPPDTRKREGEDDEEEYSVNWDKLSAQQQEQTELCQSPFEYPLKLAAGMAEMEEEEAVPATLPLLCHRVQVQR